MIYLNEINFDLYQCLYQQLFQHDVIMYRLYLDFCRFSQQVGVI
jgi:hypothetical protein